MSEARDAMSAALLACIQDAPDSHRQKLFAAIKAFMAEHTERKTSLSRFCAHLIAPAASDEKQVAAAKPAAAKKAATPRAKAKKKTG